MLTMCVRKRKKVSGKWKKFYDEILDLCFTADMKIRK